MKHAMHTPFFGCLVVLSTLLLWVVLIALIVKG